MTEFYVSLHSMTDVKEFVAMASILTVDVDVISGRYTVDGKSILGLCSLELEHPVKVQVYGEDEAGQAFQSSVGRMVVEAPQED